MARVLSLVLVPVLTTALMAAHAFASASAPPASASAKRDALAWMCLERCGEDVASELTQLRAFAAAKSLTACSYEAYDLGWGSALVWNNFTRVSPVVRALGLQSLPMITTVHLDKMRALWADPHPFIDAALAEARTWQYDGYNIDFEPDSTNCTDADGASYAAFVDTFARALHGAGLTLSVDVASWNKALWHLGALAHGTAVDWLGGMDTYVYDFPQFDAALQQNVAVIGASKLSAGLDTEPGPFNGTGLAARFDAITRAGVTRVCVWRLATTDALFQQSLATWLQG